MGYILFLIALLVSTVYYLRIARRFESFDVRVTEDLHREMNSLILDFNQTANQNIGILEDRMAQGKVLVGEISEQLGYLKKLRDTLGEEVRELQRTKLELEGQLSALEIPKEHSIAVESYKKVESELRRARATKDDVPKKRKQTKDLLSAEIFEESQDIVDVASESVLFSQTLFSEDKDTLKKEPAKISKARRLKKSVPILPPSSQEEPLGTKEKILAHSHAGKSTAEISRILGVTKGEVDLVIKLYQSAG